MKKKKQNKDVAPQSDKNLYIEWAAHVIAYRAVFFNSAACCYNPDEVKFVHWGDELVALKRAIAIIRELKSL